MEYPQLKLESQLCFPLYALSRLVTREYQPHFDVLGITYPQYLVLLVLWEEKDGMTVVDIADRLLLGTNTVTPLLKRMEKERLIRRHRSKRDERKVVVSLTPQGRELREQAAAIPLALGEKLMQGPLKPDELATLQRHLRALVDFLA